ncbi:hypothetical protein [Burkholderia sp. Ac-20345]|uniref:hypothetical protein n=1 Tax=Burkholderia sp. Ac-20345 TaxID=2703891 RepID=UPI00197C3C43|nr:hypothetical protein [Burkholderia sp. Ac-20345]
MAATDYLLDLGHSVAYYPGLVKHLGSVNAVLFFSQIFYWQDKAASDLGVYKTVEEIEAETGMTYREQVTARKQLVERGVLIETNKRLEHRVYYRIDLDRLNEMMESANCGKRISGEADSAVRGTAKAQVVNKTKTTTETTSKSTADLSAIRHFVIDSLMMTDVPEDGHGAMTVQKEAMRLLANFARQYNVHVHLVAHPRKGQDEKRSLGKMDVGGSGKITGAADNVFSVWLAQKDQDDQSVDEPDALFTLLKARHGEMQRRSLALFLNRDCMQFGASESRRPFVYLPYSRSHQEQPA